MNIEAKEIQFVDIDELKPNSANRNIHSPEQIDRLCKLIQYQGFRAPIVVSNLSGLVVSGHGRLLAAKQLKMKQVPVVAQDFADEAQEMAYGVSDNAIGAWAELDMSNILDDMKGLDDGFDFDLFGIKNLDLSAFDTELEGDPDEVPDVPVEPQSKLGDLYQLGNHWLLCGDSTSIDAVETLMDGKSTDLIFTDPPYSQGVNISGYLKERPSFKKLAQSDLNDFDPKDILSIISILNPPSFYVHCNKELITSYIEYARQENRNWDLLALVKANPIPNKSNKFLSDIEWIVFSRAKGAYFDDSQSYDWYRKAQKVKTKPSEFGHPTEKWVELIEQYIYLSTNKNAFVLDLFGGSGSTLIACEKTKRNCFMIELDPHYIDVIVARYVKFTGNNKIKLNGEDIVWDANAKGN